MKAPSIVAAIIQARMGSTRLPGKVMLELGGETVLDKVVRRTARASTLSAVVVATTTAGADDVIAAHCARHGYACFRGSEADVLSRYCGAAASVGADLVVRITSDCPLTDPELVDLHVTRMLEAFGRADFITNMLRETYPLGLAVEVLPLDVLARMDRLSDTPELREHVTTLAYERPELFVIEQVLDSQDRSRMRVTLDYPEDLELLRRIFDAFADDGFSWREAVALLEGRPELLEINQRHVRPGP